MRVDVATHRCQFTQPRVHDCQEFGPQSRIFGEIDASVDGRDQFIQLIENRGETDGSNGKVESQRPPFDREGEWPGATWTDRLSTAMTDERPNAR